LLGLSLGGMIACDWAMRDAASLRGAVFVNTSFGGYSLPHHRFRAGALRPILGSLRERDLVRRERAQLAITSNRTEVHDAIAARWAGIARVRPVSSENAARQLLAAARFRPPRHAPALPHLVLCGGGDKLVEPSCSRTIAEVWNAPLYEHPTAGHDLTLDAGPWVIERIQSWLADLAGGSAGV
jgi:pimeloyl-ACP methyl ester carboxylesterase